MSLCKKHFEVLKELSFMVVGSNDKCKSASAVTDHCMFVCACAVALITSYACLASEVTHVLMDVKMDGYKTL
jgi:hypothetical protein